MAGGHLRWCGVTPTWATKGDSPRGRSPRVRTSPLAIVDRSTDSPSSPPPGTLRLRYEPVTAPSIPPWMLQTNVSMGPVLRSSSSIVKSYVALPRS